ncbi:MAG: hypothetical protein ACE5GW_09015 [Planctomycetota bacterium]
MRAVIWMLVAGVLLSPFVTGAVLGPRGKTSPGEGALVGLAGVYNSIADSILANKRSESEVVRTILGVNCDLAVASLDRAARAAPGGATAELRDAARLIGDFATEGGAVIEPIRNRLLEGGHHHHADDSGPDAVYDEGYVVLKKDVKRDVLGLAKRCAQLAETSSPSARAIAAIRADLVKIATQALSKK